jgi:hypothetical protein
MSTLDPMRDDGEILGKAAPTIRAQYPHIRRIFLEAVAFAAGAEAMRTEAEPVPPATASHVG